MADYYVTTIIRESIPAQDMTALERLLLSRIFQANLGHDGWYFYTDQAPKPAIALGRLVLEEALAASNAIASAANDLVITALAKAKADETEIEIDLIEASWEFLFQDIIRRSQHLRYVSAVASFTCSKMLSDGFGGAAFVITADKILVRSTNDIIEEFLLEEKLG